MFDWGEALADAVIIAGLTFFTNLVGKVAVATPVVLAEAAVAAMVQFFLLLALKRGLVRPAGG